MNASAKSIATKLLEAVTNQLSSRKQVQCRVEELLLIPKIWPRYVLSIWIAKMAVNHLTSLLRPLRSRSDQRLCSTRTHLLNLCLTMEWTFDVVPLTLSVGPVTYVCSQSICYLVFASFRRCASISSARGAPWLYVTSPSRAWPHIFLVGIARSLRSHCLGW